MTSIIPQEVESFGRQACSLRSLGCHVHPAAQPTELGNRYSQFEVQDQHAHVHGRTSMNNRQGTIRLHFCRFPEGKP